MKNINIYAFADEASPDIDLQIKALKRNNLHGLEIRNVDGTNVSDITLQQAAEVKKKLYSNGLKVWSVGSPIGKIDIYGDFYTHLEKFKHTLEIANALDSENIRIFSFYIPDGQNPADFKNEVIDKVGQLYEISKKCGIDICHENEKGIYGDTPERCLDIFKALGEVKGIFDPANFVQCGVDTLKAWDLLGEYIKYLHIKDSAADGRIVPAGVGIGNVQEIIRMYTERGGKFLTLEPHLAVFDGLSSLERKGETSDVGDLNFKSNDEAFDSACLALNNILEVK